MVFAATAVAALAFVVVTARCAADAFASGGGYASAYGPGLYGNRMACGGRAAVEDGGGGAPLAAVRDEAPRVLPPALRARPRARPGPVGQWA